MLRHLWSDEHSEEVIVDQPIFVVPIKSFSGNALSKRKVVADFLDADLETFFKSAQLHVYDGMLLI